MIILLLAFYILNLILVAGSNSTTLLFYDYHSYWTHTSYQTGGLIDKRYANQDAEGLKRVNLQEGKMWLKTRLIVS
jgi:hypothetical protein